MKLLSKIIADNTPSRIEQAITCGKTYEFIDYLFAILGKFEYLDCPKGHAQCLAILENLLEKFKSGSDSSEVANCVMDHHIDTLNKISEDDSSRYSSSRRIARTIISEYFP